MGLDISSCRANLRTNAAAPVIGMSIKATSGGVGALDKPVWSRWCRASL